MRWPQNLKKSPTCLYSVASILWSSKKSWSIMFSCYSEQWLCATVRLKNHVSKLKFLMFLMFLLILSPCGKIFHVLVVFDSATLYSNLFLTCSWHQKKETTNSPTHQFTNNLKCCKMSFKAFKVKKQGLKWFFNYIRTKK